MRTSTRCLRYWVDMLCHKRHCSPASGHTATSPLLPSGLQTRPLCHRGWDEDEYRQLKPYTVHNLVQYRVRPVVRALGDNELESGLVRGAKVRFNDSASLKLRRRAYIQWEDGFPQSVFIVKKPKNAAASRALQEMGLWLQSRGIKVYVERVVQEHEFSQFDVFDPSNDDVDFCITLGGDGTVLYLASLFEQDEPLPPLMSFAMGSLGFLTPFDATDFRSCLARVLDTSRSPLFCTLRTRKRCEVHYAGRLQRVHHVLNEAVIDRGSFPGAVFLEIYVDGNFVTAAEADGLIIATPSGSTAYSMSAGGPMVAPSVPCTLLTPLAPLSLSFRPLIVPESSDIMVRLPGYSRSHARASFDGKHPLRVPKESNVHFTTSLCPLPVINMNTLDVDWYEGITQKLKWNQQIRDPPPSGQYESDLEAGLGGGRPWQAGGDGAGYS